MKDTTIAVDLAKNVFEIAISGEAGKVSKQFRVLCQNSALLK